MQTYSPNNQNNSPSVVNFSKRNYTRFLLFMGMTVFSVLLLVVMQAIDQRYNNKAARGTDSENKIEVQPPPVAPQTLAPVIVNIPQQPQQPQNDNDLGLTLEEYSNLSDPTDEMINCLRNEGGKGCFEEGYQPSPQMSYYEYSSANNLQAVRVSTGQVLPYWKPSSLPPVQSCLSREFLIKYGDRYYCGRRLIQQY